MWLWLQLFATLSINMRHKSRIGQGSGSPRLMLSRLMGWVCACFCCKRQCQCPKLNLVLVSCRCCCCCCCCPSHPLQEYRETTLNAAVDALYSEMASRHRVRAPCIFVSGLALKQGWGREVSRFVAGRPWCKWICCEPSAVYLVQLGGPRWAVLDSIGEVSEWIHF